MPHISGTINKIFANPIEGGDQFGNTFRHAVFLKNVDGSFGFGSSKSQDLYLKSAGELRVGDTIEFMFDENGKYKNVKRGSVQKTSAAEDKGQGSKGTGKATAQGSAPQSFGGPNPAAVGQCLNIALELGILNAKNLDDPNAQREAIITYKRVKDQLTALWDAADKEPQPFVQENENETQDNFDDDIPF